MRQTAALHVLNHGMDRSAGLATLRDLDETAYSSAARAALAQEESPLSIYFDANLGLDAAMKQLRRHRGRRQPRVTNGTRS